MQCGTCMYLHVVDGQQYFDCRVESPRVVVSGFKSNPAVQDATIGKIMTVWPRVSKNETGCGKYSSLVKPQPQASE